MFLCLEFDVVPLVSFWSSCLCFWCEIQKVTAKTDGKKTTSMYSSRGLIAYSLMLKFLIPFYLMFVYGKRQGHSFIFSKDYPVFSVPFWKPCPFPTVYSWLPFHKLTNNIWVWFLSSFSDLYVCFCARSKSFCLHYYSFLIQFEISNPSLKLCSFPWSLSLFGVLWFNTSE